MMNDVRLLLRTSPPAPFANAAEGDEEIIHDTSHEDGVPIASSLLLGSH
jgi:hypothetical protein